MEKTFSALSSTLLLLTSMSAISDPLPNEPTVQPQAEIEQTNQGTETSEPEAASENEAVQETNEIPIPVETQYITQRLPVYVHSGAGTEYRIINRLWAGDEISVIAHNQDKSWFKVNLAGDRTGWVAANVVTKQVSLKSQLDTATAKVSELEKQLSSLSDGGQQQIEQLSNQVEQLTADNQSLTSQLEAAHQESQQLAGQIQHIDETKRILAKLYDVGAVVIGIFVGWLLTRRKRNQWV